MTLITDLTSRPITDGTEEYVVNVAGVDYKVTGAAITAAIVASQAAYEISNDIAVAALTADKLNLAGGVLTGDITLSGAPTSGLHPTTKTYVDSALALKSDAIGASLSSTTTGVTAVDTVESTALATTEYVGSKIEYDVLKKTTVNNATATLTYADRGTINVTRTTAGTCTITLPDTSTLASADRTEFYIVDAGNNAETYNIIINVAGTDTFLDTTSTMSITANGESILLYASGTVWIPKNKLTNSTTTIAGATRISTNAEALALSNADSAITPLELGNVFDQEIYNSSVISTASKILTESDSKLWYVTRTSVGVCTITLPNPSTLISPSRFEPEIWDVETAGTNAITIVTTGGTIDGAASAIINIDKAGLKLINDGTNYFTIGNTQRATSTTSGTANILPKFDAAGTSLIDSLILDDGDQLGINGAVDSLSAVTLRNQAFATSLKVYNTITTGSCVAANIDSSGAGTTFNKGVSSNAQGGTASNKAYDASTNLTSAGANWAGFSANIQGVGGTVTTKGVEIVSAVAGTGQVQGVAVSLLGATSGDNIAGNFSASGASGQNYSLYLANGDLYMGDNGINMILDTTTGTKIGTATSQKLAFYGSTPIVQPLVNTDLGTVLSDLGLRPVGMPDVNSTVLTSSDEFTTSGKVRHSGNSIVFPGANTFIDLSKSTIAIGTLPLNFDTHTIADGEFGQILTLVCINSSASGGISLLPSNLRGGTTININSEGDTVTLQFINDLSGTPSWYITGGNGYTITP